MRTRRYDVLRTVVLVVALVGAMSSGNPLGWAGLVAALDRLLR